ncbi:hypothetical protein EDB80DRAFT_312637 [Ilyonectria destructans]|nr:hypothetical protein EDB80DRAFT_312637 [Ilyonectria destructans]
MNAAITARRHSGVDMNASICAWLTLSTKLLCWSAHGGRPSCTMTDWTTSPARRPPRPVCCTKSTSPYGCSMCTTATIPAMSSPRSTGGCAPDPRPTLSAPAAGPPRSCRCGGSRTRSRQPSPRTASGTCSTPLPSPGPEPPHHLDRALLDRPTPRRHLIDLVLAVRLGRSIPYRPRCRPGTSISSRNQSSSTDGSVAVSSTNGHPYRCKLRSSASFAR